MARPRAFQEEVIIQKAAQLFWKQGYSQTSVQDLVNHLGINRASLYNLYTDKDAIYIKALAHYQEVSHRMLKDLFAGEPDVRKGIENLLRYSLQSHKNNSDKPHGCMMVNCTIEMSDQTELFDFLRKNKAAFHKIMMDYLKSGVHSGQLSSDSDLKSISQYLFIFYSGLNVTTKLIPTKSEIESVITLAMKAIH